MMALNFAPMTKRRKNQLSSFVTLCSLMMIMVFSSSCVTSTEHYVKEVPPPDDAKVFLKPGDEIELKFPYWADLNDTQVIRPDGFISLQLVDAVQAAGLTPEELDSKLTGLYENKIKDPDITVVVRSLVNQRVYVGGEVSNPGLLQLQGETDVLQAVINAGGFEETAKVENVIVIRKGEDGKPIPYGVDLHKALYAENTNSPFILQANDVVFVPKSTIANLNKFVNQYIAELFLFRGIGLGFSYEIHSDGD